jgi:hypothetical protein
MEILSEVFIKVPTKLELCPKAANTVKTRILKSSVIFFIGSDNSSKAIKKPGLLQQN